MIGSSSITGPEKFQIGMEKRGKEFIFTSINYFLHMGLRFFVKSINGKPPLVFVDIWHHSQSYCDVTWHFSKPQPTECIITCIRYCPFDRKQATLTSEQVFVVLDDLYSDQKLFMTFWSFNWLGKVNLAWYSLRNFSFASFWINSSSSGVRVRRQSFVVLSLWYAALNMFSAKIWMNSKIRQYYCVLLWNWKRVFLSALPVQREAENWLKEKELVELRLALGSTKYY